jgi:hypothetical protein
MFKEINKYARKCISISEQEVSYFNSLLEYKKIKKKNILLAAGEVCDF